MKNPLQIFLFIIALQTLNSQNVKILKDISPGSDDGINFYGTEYAIAQDKFYFLAKPFFVDKIHVSNGVSGNATLMNLNDSIYDTKLLTMVGKKLFFTGRSSSNALFVFDETTNKVTNLLNTTGGRNFNIFSFGDHSILYLRSKTYMDKPDQIWISDGTISGTKLIFEGGDFPTLIRYSRFGDALIISDHSTNLDQKQAFICDGTPQGSMTIKEYLKSKLDMELVDDAIGTENNLFLYSKLSDGKFNNYGISKLGKVIGLGNIGNLINVQELGTKYIMHTTGFSTLNAYDTITAKIETLADINRFEFSSSGNQRFFFTKSVSQVTEFWETDGTIAGTRKINNVGRNNMNYFNAISINSKIHYLKDTLRKVQLWEYDIQSRTNSLITVLFDSPSIGYLPTLFYFKDKLYFGRSSANEGFEFWFYEGFSVGTNEPILFQNTIYYNASIDKIIFLNAAESAKRISIINFNGQIIYSNQFLKSNDLDLGPMNLSPGLYILSVETAHQNYTLKFIKS